MSETSIKDFAGVRIGNAENVTAATGCTVFIFPEGAATGLSVRGGGPASRESELLKPLAAADRIHSVVLSGGMVSFATEQVAEKLEDDLQIIERESEPPAPAAAPEANQAAEPVRERNTRNEVFVQ